MVKLILIISNFVAVRDKLSDNNIEMVQTSNLLSNPTQYNMEVLIAEWADLVF